jgi:ABC-type cobalamin transport system ATPase subunit
MQRDVINRQEMLTATLNLGGAPISLADYATTGLAAVAVGPRGCGKTNACLLMAEQLSEQGWVAVLIDPESELDALQRCSGRCRRPEAQAHGS